MKLGFGHLPLLVVLGHVRAQELVAVGGDGHRITAGVMRAILGRYTPASSSASFAYKVAF